MSNPNIQQLTKINGKYDISVFSAEAIDRLEKSLFEKSDKPYLTCLVREKEIQTKPEEIIRQLMLDKLINEYGYPKDLLQVESKDPLEYSSEHNTVKVPLEYFLLM